MILYFTYQISIVTAVYKRRIYAVQYLYLSIGTSMDKALTILIVDDLATNRKMLSTFLTPIDFDIVEACDDKQVLELFDKKHPDLVILDLNMPQQNGFEVCKRLNKFREYIL